MNRNLIVALAVLYIMYSVLILLWSKKYYNFEMSEKESILFLILAIPTYPMMLLCVLIEYLKKNI